MPLQHHDPFVGVQPKTNLVVVPRLWHTKNQEEKIFLLAPKLDIPIHNAKDELRGLTHALDYNGKKEETSSAQSVCRTEDAIPSIQARL